MTPIILPFPMNESPPIVIADISRYQASNPLYPPVIPFDFDKYWNKGGRAIILRFSVAADGEDYQLDYNLQQAKDRDMPVIGYHYFKAWKNLDKQASIFNDAIRKALSMGVKLIGVEYDVESNDGLDKTTFTANVTKGVNKLDDVSDFVKIDNDPTKSNLGIYTAAYFWNYNTYRTDLFKYLPLHIAHHFYGIDPLRVPTVRPYIPDDWAAINNPVNPHFWQFDTNDSGFDWGSNGDDEIDLNWFTWKGGTYSAFEERYGVKLAPIDPPTEPPIPPLPVDKEYVTSLVNYLRVRSAPNTSATIKDQLMVGDRTEALEEYKDASSNVWIRIGWKQWSAMLYYGNRYLEYK